MKSVGGFLAQLARIAGLIALVVMQNKQSMGRGRTGRGRTRRGRGETATTGGSTGARLQPGARVSTRAAAASSSAAEIDIADFNPYIVYQFVAKCKEAMEASGFEGFDSGSLDAERPLDDEPFDSGESVEYPEEEELIETDDYDEYEEDDEYEDDENYFDVDDEGELRY